MSVRASAAALAPGLLLALALQAGEAAAQNVCRGGSHTGGGIITCIEGAGSSADILVDPGSLGINHATANIVAVEGSHSGSGDIELRMKAGSVVTTGTAGHGLYAQHAGATGGGAIVVRMSGGSVETRGSNAYAIRARRASGTGNVRIDVTGGSLSRTAGTGVVVAGRHAGTGDVTINMSGGATLEATGAGVGGLTGTHSGTGHLTVSLTGGSIATTGNGVAATRSNAATAGNVAVTVSHANSVVKTTGAQAHGVSAANSGSGDAAVTMRDGLVETTGAGARGLSAYSPYTGTSPGTVSIVLEGGTVRTRGGTHTVATFNLHAHGVYAESNNGRGDVSVRMTGGAVETAGASANGLYVLKGGPAGAGSIEMTGGSVTTAGDGANGAYVYMYDTGASTEGLSIDAAGAVSVEGLNARGLLGVHTGLGSATVTTRAGAKIAAPFAVGMEGRATNDASAAGRVLVTHGGAVSARDAGILAWAARSSGHTMGAGARTADDAARTEPMVHVTSSGDVTVGASVADAFIRSRIAGADETLSAAEQAVLSAVAAGDSDALTTALAALPASYDAAWQAEARNLLRKRAASSAAPTGDGPLAHRAAEEILGLSRAGVRALALSHTAIADHVRAGDALSAAERAALAGVLTGSGLETALTALTGAAYTTAWKNTVRRLASTYNAGDVQVDVTGGSITAEGNGVEALYAVPHDRNGAIVVSVAAGATVTGGANGLYVRGAGAGEGSLRAQSVTVNGRVMGGTGAGVHMAGGGRLVVGKTGRVGATSGVGVLSDGAGDLHATVAGTVEGDVRVRGGGALTLDVMEGGAVTGTVRDPVGLSTVVGSIGRLLYSDGAAVTVAATGRLTGVEVDGRTEALRSEGGDLSMIVAGMVTGDVLGLGDDDDDDHMVTVARGGTVTGTIRLAASTVRVDGSVGCVRLDRGGTVTVGASGRIACTDGAGVRSDAGALVVTVAGTVNGIDAGGDLDLRILAAAGERLDQAARRAAGRIAAVGDRTVTVVVGGKTFEIGSSGTPEAAPSGPYDVGLEEDADGGVRLVPAWAPRSRVYEALPSVLLGLNVPPTHRDRLAGRRSQNGTWVRVAAGGGERRAKRSTSGPGIAYDHRSYGVTAGVDFPFGMGRAGLAGVSAHHLRGTAALAGGDGEIEAAGTGFGLSAAWAFGGGVGGVYVDGQFQATWYELDLSSGLRGALQSGVTGTVWAAGLEAGRRFAVGPGLTLTPRARLARSDVKVGAFTDSVGSRVSAIRRRSLSGRAGVELEAAGEGGRLFGALELEHEFQPDTQTEVSGVKLSSEEAGTRVLAELGVMRSWGEGRYAVRSILRYATAVGRGGSRDYGGGLSLSIRF